MNDIKIFVIIKKDRKIPIQTTSLCSKHIEMEFVIEKYVFADNEKRR